MTTKLNGFNDICPAPNEAFAHLAPKSDDVISIKAVLTNGELVSPKLKPVNILLKGTAIKYRVYKLIE